MRRRARRARRCRSCSPTSPFAAMRSAPVNDGVDLARGHQRRRRAVHDHGRSGCRAPRAPRRSAARPAAAAASRRPRRVDAPALPCGTHRAERRAVAAGREAAGVAVRQHPRARAGRARRRAAPSAGSGRPPRRAARAPAPARIAAHLVERPAEVDRGRPRRREDVVGRVEVLASLPPPARARTRGDADRRRTAYASVRIASATSASSRSGARPPRPEGGAGRGGRRSGVRRSQAARSSRSLAGSGAFVPRGEVLSPAPPSAGRSRCPSSRA